MFSLIALVDFSLCLIKYGRGNISNYHRPFDENFFWNLSFIWHVFKNLLRIQLDIILISKIISFSGTGRAMRPHVPFIKPGGDAAPSTPAPPLEASLLLSVQALMYEYTS